MKRCLPICLLLTACAGASRLPAPIALDEVVSSQRLQGPEGLSFEVSQTQEKALVQVSGVSNEYEGVVFDCTLSGSRSARYFETQIDGRAWRVLIRDKGGWKTFVPGARNVMLEEIDGEVDTKALLKAHLQQLKSGRIADIARFDEAGAQARGLEGLKREVDDAAASCGGGITTEIDWASLSQEELMEYSIDGYCDSGIAALERACKTPELKATLGAQIQTYRCTFGEASDLSIVDGVMSYTVHFGASNLDDWARKALDDHPFEGERTVLQARHEHDSAVCRFPDGEGVLVVGNRQSERFGGIGFGRMNEEGTTVHRQPQRRFLPNGWFFEPRFRNPKNNDGFRGYDLRVYSHVDLEEGDDGAVLGCSLTCGTEQKALQLMTAEEKRSFFASASFEPLPSPREAYALARDRRGRYYYVDRGASAETERDFRLYIGRPGRLVRQKMKDIVSDSKGEIFESRNGKLRLLLAKEEAEWISAGRRRRLTRVPVSENYELIYGRLGVYLGTPLYSPCDAFY
ncbi:MAG: hypothetical protein AAGJ19_18090 [Myxococcota bacterium]